MSTSRRPYQTIQKSDESNDSYLARHDANFEELLARSTTLEEVRAYVLPRQSNLNPEDKKKIVVEQSGKLQYEPVAKAVRFLGSRFFQKFQGGRQPQSKTRIYDVNFTEGPEEPTLGSSGAERAFAAQNQSQDEVEPELDAEFIEVMVAQEDQDALMVAGFENELEELFQDVPALHEAMSSYVEAGQRLMDKRKTRGFWPVKGRGKGKGFAGSFKGKGKGKREQLLARIARSKCRLCGERGHWRAECPNRDQGEKKESANVAMSATVASDNEVDEVFEEQDLPEGRHQSNPQEITCETAFVLHLVSREKAQQMASRFLHSLPNPRRYHPSGFASKTADTCESLFRKPHRDRTPNRRFSQFSDKCCASESVVLSCEQQAHAILDTGASRCVIGQVTLDEFLDHLDPTIVAQIKRSPSQVTFRFGNNQTLSSQHRIYLPLQHAHKDSKVWLAIEVVPGRTPFLFSKKAFKQLGGVLDTATDTCRLDRLAKSQRLTCSASGLYLLDMSKIVPHAST